MATLSLAVAASVNFVIIALLSLYWKDLTTRGAIWGGSIGLTVAVVLVVLSKAIWVDVFGFITPIYPYAHPTLFSMSATILITVTVSWRDRSDRAARERIAFSEQELRSEFSQK